MKHSTADTRAWWDGLTKEERRKVRNWLTTNPPPRNWQGSATDYAYAEMPCSARIVGLLATAAIALLIAANQKLD